MPKNEGTKGQLIGRGVIGGNKTVPPIEDTPATYQELGIAYRDAARWQKAAEHEIEPSGTAKISY